MTEAKSLIKFREFGEASKLLNAIILVNSDRIPKEVLIAILSAQRKMIQAVDDTLTTLREELLR